MSRILELSPSSFEFDSPSSTAARIPSRWARMVFDSFTNAGILDRHAQASHRSRNWWAAPRSRRRYTSRRASFSCQARYSTLRDRRSSSRTRRWEVVRRPGSFTSAHRVRLTHEDVASPERRARFHAHRRAASMASLASFTTWKGSMHTRAVTTNPGEALVDPDVTAEYAAFE